MNKGRFEQEPIPRLISGQLRLPEAETVLEKA